MKTKERIAFDIDGVTEDCVTEGLFVMNQRLGTSYEHKDMASWHWIRDETLRLTNDPEMAEDMESCLFDPNVLWRAKPYPGAVAVLALLSIIRDVHFISTRRGDARETTFASFENHFPWAVRENRIHMRTPLDVVSGDTFKREETRVVGPKRFYEDNVDSVKDLALITDAKLVDRPWNRKGADDLNGRRIKGGWAGILLNEVFFSKPNSARAWK